MPEIYGKTPRGKTAIIASVLAAASRGGFNIVVESPWTNRATSPTISKTETQRESGV